MFSYSLEEGLLNLQFCLCTRRIITSLLFIPIFFFVPVCPYEDEMPQLTWRLKHKEIDITQWTSEGRGSKKKKKRYRNGLHSVKC